MQGRVLAFSQDNTLNFQHKTKPPTWISPRLGNHQRDMDFAKGEDIGTFKGIMLPRLISAYSAICCLVSYSN
jgi:hypothetical protein